MKTIHTYLEEIRSSSIRRRRWLLVTVCLSVLVVLTVGWMTRLSGITLSANTICGQQAHTHTADCQKDVSTEACIQLHVHDSTCGTDGNWSCGLSDIVIHKHDDICYDIFGRRRCQLEENEIHEHTTGCYEAVYNNDPGHTHSTECYSPTVSETPVCGKDETEGHVHIAAGEAGSCYPAYICGDTEEGHIHEAACYGDQTPSCGEAAGESHTHSVDCYQGVNCGKTEEAAHTHVSPDCYTVQGDPICGETEREPNNDFVENKLVCTIEIPELHTHIAPGETNSCYSPKADAPEEFELTCGKIQLLEHSHTVECFTTQTQICGKEEHVHELACYEKAKAVENLLKELPSSAEVRETAESLKEDRPAQVAYANEWLWKVNDFVIAYDNLTPEEKTLFDSTYPGAVDEYSSLGLSLTILAQGDSIRYTTTLEGLRIWITFRNPPSEEKLPRDAQLHAEYLSSSTAEYVDYQNKVYDYLNGGAEKYRALEWIMLNLWFTDAEGNRLILNETPDTYITITFNPSVMESGASLEKLRTFQVDGDGELQLLGPETMTSTPTQSVASMGMITNDITDETGLGSYVLVQVAPNTSEKILLEGTLDSWDMSVWDTFSNAEKTAYKNGTPGHRTDHITIKDGIRWTLVENDQGNRVLRIEGTGDVPDFINQQRTPWYNYRSVATQIEFYGVSHTGRYTCSGWQVSDIYFDKTVETIGSQSLSYLGTLVDVTIPGTVKKVETSAFVYSYGLQNFYLNEGLEYIGDSAFGAQTAYQRDIIAKIPASVSHIEANAFWLIAGYEVHPDNPYYQEIDGVLCTKPDANGDVTMVDYPNYRSADLYEVPEEITIIGTAAMKGITYRTRSIYVGDHVKKLIGDQTFRDGGFEEIAFGNDVPLAKSTTSYAFRGNQNLTSITFPEDGDTPLQIGTSYFGNCTSLSSIRIPANTKLIGDGAFENTTSLTEMYYNARDPQNGDKDPIHHNAFSGNTENIYFDLTIGPDVDRLPASFNNIVRHASKITFVGKNVIYVEPGAFASGPNALKDLSGWVLIDENGAVYKEIQADPGVYEAGLYYYDGDAESLTIPSSFHVTHTDHVEGADDDVHVTGIIQDALQDAPNLKTLVFEDISQIRIVEPYAMANCPLECIEDVATGRKAVTEAEAVAFFSDKVQHPEGTDGAGNPVLKDGLGFGAFYNTNFGDSVQYGPDFVENMNGIGALSVSTADTVNNATATMIVTFNSATKEWIPVPGGDPDFGGYKCLTGDQSSFTISASNLTGKAVRYRAIFQRTGSDGMLGYTPSSKPYEVGEDEHKVQLYVSSGQDPNTVVMEFTVGQEKTIGINVDASYLSPTSPGGGYTVTAMIQNHETGEWLPALDKNGKEASVMAGWVTKPERFLLTETENTHSNFGVLTDSEGVSRPAADLDFRVDFTRQEEANDAYGKDYVTYVEMKAVLNLPKGMRLSRELLMALNARILNGVSFVNGVGYVNNVKMFTIERPTSPLTLSNPSAYLEFDETGEAKLALSWRVKNTGKGDMVPNGFKILYHPDAFVLDMIPDNEFSVTINPNITNEVVCNVTGDIHYTYSAPQHTADDAHKVLQLGAGVIRLTKTANMVTYFGEDITYNLNLYNDGGMPWIAANAGRTELVDTLAPAAEPKRLYIKPENMEKMFREAEAGGTPLTITITDAEIFRKEASGIRTVTTVSGEDQAYLHTGNTQLDNTYKATLIITYNNGSYIVRDSNTNAGPSGESLVDCLREIGFGPGLETGYTCRWALGAEGEKYILNPGRIINRRVYATVKDTFMMNAIDWPNEYPREQNDTVLPGVAEVKIHYKNPWGGAVTDQPARSGNPKDTVKREAWVSKNVSRNGVVLGSTPEAQDGSILDYRITFEHYGTGIYEDLPIVDTVSGSQYLLLPKIQNDELKFTERYPSLKMDTVTHKGVEYYVLHSTGVFEDVVVGRLSYREGTFTSMYIVADQVTVVHNGGSHDITIKWYIAQLEGHPYTFDINYATQVHIGTDVSYSIGNQVWINDRPGTRIYAALWGGGTLIDFDKQIVTELGDPDNPHDDVIQEDRHLGVSRGETITYRLLMSGHGNSGTYIVNGSEIADSLPSTMTLFNWEKSDVTIRAVPDFNGEEGELHSVENWQALDDDENWSIQDNYLGFRGGDFIRWKDDMQVTFRGNGRVWLYVTLQFPQEEAQWKEYCSEVAGAEISNTFYVYRYPATVTHVLKTPGEVRIQKGVYALLRSNGPTVSDNRMMFATGTSRMYYNNRDITNRMVIYYVNLYNGAAPRLYLNNIQDVLPKGFSYLSMLENPGSLQGNEHGFRNNINTAGGTDNPFTIEQKSSVKYVSAQVRAISTEKGVTFQITGRGNNGAQIHYDEKLNKYYLQEGEALLIPYVALIGDSFETDPLATNVVGMPYTDYMAAGVEISPSGQVMTKDHMGTYNDQNNGECMLTSSGDAFDRYGLADVERRQWIISDVTLIQGGIKPGIRKNVEHLSDGKENTRPYTTAAKAVDTIHWATIVYNGGELNMVDYMLRDVMEAPYVFTGPVQFNIYDQNRMEIRNAVLFTIDPVSCEDGFGNDLTGLEEIPIRISDNANFKSATLKVGDEMKYFTAQYGHKYYEFGLRFVMEDGSLVMELDAKDLGMTIAEGNTMKLSYATYNPTQLRPTRIFNNVAEIYPSQRFERGSIQMGKSIMQDSKLVGVTNFAPVNVTAFFTTTAVQTVAENGNSSNIASTEKVAGNDKDTIVVPSVDSSFRYDLQVTNGSTAEQNPDMTQLVLLTNLPRVGDTYSANIEEKRGSEFDVWLDTANTNFAVVITKEDGTSQTVDPSLYTIQYTERTGDFVEADRNGTSEGWHTYDSENPPNASEVGALRIILGNGTASVLQKGDKLSFQFNAKAAYAMDKTKPPVITGDTAWSNFNYSYKFQGINETLEAMPARVGVQLASEPFLQKVTVDLAGRDVVLKERHFSFLIHSGEALADGYDVDDLDAVLTEEGRAYDRWILTVKENGRSEEIKLTTDKINWTHGEKYTVVELGLNPEEFQLHHWDLDGKLSYQRSATFTYNIEKPTVAVAYNAYQKWDLNLLKTDAKDASKLLAGAKFALYGREDRGSAETADAPATMEINGVTWYLYQEQTTGQDGRTSWVDLDQAEYYLVETRAPDGYMRSTRKDLIVRPQVGIQVAVTRINDTSVELPETGGVGISLYTLSGWSLMGIFALAYNKKRKNRKRGDGQ